MTEKAFPLQPFPTKPSSPANLHSDQAMKNDDILNMRPGMIYANSQLLHQRHTSQIARRLFVLYLVTLRLKED